MSVKDRIRPAVEGPLAHLGLLVEDVAVTPAGKRRLVRIWIDRAVEVTGDSTSPTPPLALDEVADATRVVSEALDDADAMGEQPYTLEVTSPGVERPLTEPRHYRRNVGRLVLLTLADGGTLTGRIVRAGVDGLTVEVPAARRTPARTEDVAYAAVSRAAVQVEFSRPAGAEHGTDEQGTDEPASDEQDMDEQDMDEQGTDEPDIDEQGIDEPDIDEQGIDEPDIDETEQEH